MDILFPSEGAPMMFERERYPSYTVEQGIDEVLVEQARVLAQALPIRRAKLVQGDLVSMTAELLTRIGGSLAEILVDTSTNPELKQILDLVRAADSPLDINIFAQWTITRSDEHWLALLYLNFEYGSLVAKFHLAFEMRDEGTQKILTEIENQGRLIIDDAAAPDTKITRVVNATSAVDLALGQSRASVVERMRGLTIEVPSSLVNAFSHSPLFALATKNARTLASAWPRLNHLDRELLKLSRKSAQPFIPPPLDTFEALAGTRACELYLAHCSWFGSPMENGFGMVKLVVDHGISEVAKKQRPGGWQQVVLRGENVEWLPGYAVAAWEMVLTWKPVSGDAWSLLLDMLRNGKFDVVPIDLMPMLFFLGQAARSSDLVNANTWAEAVPMYEVGLLPLIPALVQEWAEQDSERRHHPALSHMVLNEDLQRKSNFLRVLLHSIRFDMSDLHACEIEVMDAVILRLLERLARSIWEVDMRGIIGALLAAENPDMPALVGVSVIDALICASTWLLDPPNPLFQQSVPIALVPILWYQHQLIRRDIPADLGRDDLRFLTHDLTENYQIAGVPFSRRILPWTGVEKDNRIDLDREQQIGAAVYWLLDQVHRAEQRGVARPAVGRFELDVPPGFDDLHHYGVEQLRIVATNEVFLVRLMLREGLGGVVLAWHPKVQIEQHWRLLVPESVIWQLHLALASVYRDVRVEGRDQVLISVPREPTPPPARHERGRGRGGAVLLPRPLVERVRLGRGYGPMQRATRHQWSDAEEREYIQKRKHGVRGKFVKLPDHWRASEQQRELVKGLGLPELPDFAMTYRRPHVRGSDDPQTVARPVRAKGLLIAMGVIDSIRQARKKDQHDA